MPMVMVKLEERELWALLDPGATRSFIDPKVADELAEFVQELHTPFEYVRAGGTLMTASRVINNAVLGVDRWSGRHPLFVVSLGYDIILGYDFLTKVGALWDFRDRTLQFVRESVLSEDKKIPVWQNVLSKTEVKPLSVPGVPVDYLQALTWVGKESLRKIEATKRYRANVKQKAKFVKGVESTSVQREEGSEPEPQKDPMYLIMPPPKERKGPKIPSALRKGVESKEEETFRFPSEVEVKVWKQGQEKGTDSVHAVREKQRLNDVSVNKQAVDNGYTCSVQQMRKWVERKQVNCVMAVKVAVDEPVINAQCVRAYTQTEIGLPSEVLKSKGIVLEERFRVLLDSYADVFREIRPGGITERVQKHHIGTIPGLVPNYRRGLYPMSEERLRKLKELLQTLIEKGFIVPSNSPIAAPVFFVEKKGTEDLRLVIDYLELNKITIKDDYPIPRVHDLIDRLGRAQWFSKLNLTSGYYQVQVAEQDQWKTTFRTRYGTFKFRVLPFGLAGAPSTFQRAIGAVLEQGQPIAFESKKLGVQEQFIPAYESELLAIVYASMKWKQLIGTKKVRIETYHATLGRMLSQKNVTPRLGYWLDKLADFDIEVVYKPGKQNVVADALSRRPDFAGAIVHSKTKGVKLVTEEARWEEQYPKCRDFKEIVKACKRHQEGEQNDKGLTLEGREYRLTKMAHFIPTRQCASTEAVAKLLMREVVRLHGVPSDIVRNRDTRFTSEVQRAKRELRQAQEYQKRYADRKRRDVQFKAGEQVWLSTANITLDGEAKALKPKFIGPFRILKMYGANAAFWKDQIFHFLNHKLAFINAHE
ncbi:retrotransposon protein [Cystoisospora suis]|uniref:RNA-directed DNA polymerase n=1 Tax=Cystoisospora suis TaxID=483139 RepID=A0A2C6KEL0_9APIC|nr:retrotransposon protein [Cystoisospora suis]